MKKFKKAIAMMAALTLAAISFVGCSSSDGSNSSSDQSGSKDGVTKIKVAYTQGNAPSEFTNEDGEPDGYDIKALQEVDKLLEDYEFEYVATTMDDLTTGVTEGVYQMGVSGSFKTVEREEKMLFPNEPIGASVVGLTVRKENSDCKTIRDCVEKGLKMSPISSSDGLFAIVESYNEENPDAQIEMSTTSATTLADFYIYIQEGRYDYLLFPTSVWTSLVEGDDAELAYLKDELVTYNITAVPTWTLLNKDQTELATAIDGALKQLKDDGTLSKLQVEYFGEDQFTYLDSDSSSEG